MSERDETTPEEAEAGDVRLRRRLLGYKRTDVESALRARDESLDDLEDELDTRDAELSQLRQDIAALWLAFAQHDRTIEDLRAAVIALADSQPAAAATSPRPIPRGTAVDEERQTVDEILEEEEHQPPAPVEGAEPSVGRQLADLDEVLAAIEMATQTLEQTYAEEIEETRATAEAASPDDEDADPVADDEAESERSGGD